MNILFLDYDGVVNTPMWNEEGTHCYFGSPEDQKVNNFQCVQWVSEFCEKYDFSIVVTSSWRLTTSLYGECLYNGGLRRNIKIIGCTAVDDSYDRESEIATYLKMHNGIDKYLIFDDCEDFDCLKDHLVQCETDVGFNILKFKEAEELYDQLYRKRN